MKWYSALGFTIGAGLLAACASTAALSGGPPLVEVAIQSSPIPSVTTPPSATLEPTATDSPAPTFTASATNTPTETLTNSPTATDTPKPQDTASPLPGIERTDLAESAFSETDRAPRTPTPAGTPTNTLVVPHAERSVLVRPPDTVTFDEHLWFVRPLGAGANVSPSAVYRYGMTFDGTLAPHHGVDLSNSTGTSVVAAGAGTVIFAGADLAQVFGTTTDFYGNLVVMEMADRWNGHTVYTLYGHLSSLAVTTGQTAFAGDTLGGVGSTGIAGGPHLHFEVRLDDPNSYWAVRNPELWYRPIGGRGVLAGRIIDAKGRFVPGVRIRVLCRDGASRYYDTYWDQGTPPDNVLVENFAMSDLPAGFCQVEADIDGETVSTSVEIGANQLAFVVLEASGD